MPPVLPIPELPEAIKQAVNRDELAVFVGAGASRLMGCMGWDELARNLTAACHDASYINYKEKEALSLDPDHRKTITICHYIAEREANTDFLFSTTLNEPLSPRRTWPDVILFKSSYTSSEPSSLLLMRTNSSRGSLTRSQSSTSCINYRLGL